MSLAAAGAALALAAGEPGSAQTVVRTSPTGGAARPGWIGINLEVNEVYGERGRMDSRLVIRGVVDGSPADRARIQPGDVIVRLNGQPATFEAFARLASRLRPGDRFDVTLSREGERWEGWKRAVTLEAAEKPAGEMMALPGEIVNRLDAALQRLDSVRLQMADAEGAVRASARRLERADSLHHLAGTAHLLAMGPDSSRTFVFYSTGSGAADTGTLVRIGETRASGAPVAENQAGTPGAEPRERASSYRFLFRDGPDADSARGLRGVFGPGAPTPAETVELRRVAEAEARALAEDVAVSGVGIRPLTPYIVGRNRVAGAELTPLNPTLARYFDVERGLLVTTVAEGTPAADAGLRPGDVVVRVGQVDVPSLAKLRSALDRSPVAARVLQVVRRGDTLRVSLPR